MTLLNHGNKPLAKISGCTYILIILLLNVTLYSQKNISSFQIKDEKTQSPIPYCYTIIKGKNISSQSDENGITKIQTGESDSLIIYQLGYSTKRTTISQINSLNNIVFLRSKSITLQEIIINSNKTDTFQANNNSVFLDFDFYDDHILSLVNKGKKYNTLMITDINGNKISEKYLSVKAEILFKDCFDNLHLITKDSVFQIYYNYQNITLLKPYSIQNYYNVLKPCECNYGDKYIFKIKQYRELKNTYYIYDKKTKGKKQMLTTVSDSSAIRGFNMDYDLNYFLAKRRLGEGYNLSVTEINKRIDQLREELVLPFDYKNTLRPAESEIKKTDSLFVLFDYTNNTVSNFTCDGVFIKKQSLNNFKDIIPKIYMDYDLKNMIFSSLAKNGVLTLYRYDVEKNAFSHKYKLNHFYFIKSFKIKENNLYFINKDRSSPMTKIKLVKEHISWQTL